MISKVPILFGLCFFISIHTVCAQDQANVKFGIVTSADFNITPPQSDTGAAAIISADIGKVSFEQNEAGDFDVVLKRFLRVKIINKNGFDAGKFILRLRTVVPYNNILLRLPKPGLVSLKGSTFNLENGMVTEVKLDAASVVAEKEGKNLTIEKFVLPALKAGSIFDVEYTTRSAFIVQDISWNFQSAYPCLWSEYDLTLPDAYQYTIKYQGDTGFDIHTVEMAERVSEYTYHTKLLMSHFRWVKKNVPAIYLEPFVGSLKNYVNRVSLLHRWYFSFPRANIYYSSDTWESFTKLYFLFNGMQNFGEEKYGWIRKEVERITAGLKTKQEIAQAIYKYIRDHYLCTNRNFYFASQSMKETFRDKTGDVADINLLLTAMLNHARIEADPAVLSTIENGNINLKYPLGADYNYLICVANIEGKEVLLDASQPLNPFGNLMPDCFNGGAVTLNARHSKFIELHPDSLLESNRTNVIITEGENGILSGSLTVNCGVQKSYSIRKELKKNTAKAYFKSLVSDPQIMDLSNEELDSLDNPDRPLSIHCDLDFKNNDKSDVIYLKPVLLTEFETNPFIAVKRKYSVEMPYRVDNIYLLTLDIPKGYRVEEMPVSAFIHMNFTEGSFEYTIEKNRDDIQLKIRMRLNKTFFTPEEYITLREFFSDILKKENEFIVFRKIKP